MKLLTEWTPLEYDTSQVFEKEKDSGKIILTGVLQKAETLNQNGRIYPFHILEREVRNYQKFIKENRALGECDHPDSSVVELKKVSHIIRSASMEGNVCYGAVELLDTPCGQILKNLIKAGVTLGISSRGIGSTKKEGDKQIVQDDFQLICWDIVAEPSTPGAFLVAEGKEITPKEIRRTFTKTDRIDRLFNELLKNEEKL